MVPPHPAIVLRAAATVLSYTIVSGFAARGAAEILGRLGAFGSGHYRQMGVILIGFPPLWVLLLMLLFLMRDWPLGGLVQGWRGFAFVALIFIVMCIIGIPLALKVG